MATIYVYNNLTNTVEKYIKDWSDALPYVEGRTLTMKEFRGSSCSSILWTDRRALLAWNKTRETYGAPIPVFFAFKRIWEGGHSGQSQHYAGVSFDVGQSLTQAERVKIHSVAEATGAWGYVEPLSLTPGWVHFDRRIFPPACSSGGYPLLQRGSRGVYVFILQDALNTLGFTGGGLDGIFGPGVGDALRRFQTSYGLVADGYCGCNTWRMISANTVGRGQTATTIGRC